MWRGKHWFSAFSFFLHCAVLLCCVVVAQTRGACESGSIAAEGGDEKRRVGAAQALAQSLRDGGDLEEQAQETQEESAQECLPDVPLSAVFMRQPQGTLTGCFKEKNLLLFQN